MTSFIVFDLDGTLTRQRGGFELLHTLYGTKPKGEELMSRLEQGEISFHEWCQATVDLWRKCGVTKSDIDKAVRASKLKPGAAEVLSELYNIDIAFGILSAGLANFATQFEQYDPAFIRGNWIRFEDSQIAGIDVGVGPNEKGEILEAIRKKENGLEVTYIGDSHTDTEAFVEADTAILFDPDSRVPERGLDSADTIIRSSNLEEVVPYLPDT